MRSHCCLIVLMFALTLPSVHAQSVIAKESVETIVTLPEDAVALLPDSLTGMKENGKTTRDQAGSTKSVSQSSDLRQCGMQWHRDEGGYSVWRPTRPVFIIVTVVRGGRVVGSVNHTVRPPNQEISLLMNRDGQNWDGVHSCTVTI